MRCTVVFVLLTACAGDPLVFPYPAQPAPATPVAITPTTAAPVTRLVPMAPPVTPAPRAPRTGAFRLPDGRTVTFHTDDAPLPAGRPDDRSSSGPAGTVVVDGAGREAWLASAGVEELFGAPSLHARIDDDLPAGTRLLPIADLDDFGCLSPSVFALFDPRAGLAYLEMGEPLRLERAPGAAATGAESETVLLRFVRRSPRSGDRRVLYGPRALVEAAPSGGAPGGWLLFRDLARVPGRPLDELRDSPAAPGLRYATVREAEGDGGATYRYWMTIDGRRVEAFDAALEDPEGGYAGTWRAGDRVIVWMWEPFWSVTYVAVVDARTGRRTSPPISVSPQPDWELCSAAALHDNRVIPVIGDGEADPLSFVFLAGHSQDEWDERAILYGPSAPYSREQMGRIVPSTLPNLEDHGALPAVLRFVPCAEGRCLAPAPGTLVTGPVATEF